MIQFFVKKVGAKETGSSTSSLTNALSKTLWSNKNALCLCFPHLKIMQLFKMV
jgi:hypothetical protein